MFYSNKVNVYAHNIVCICKSTYSYCEKKLMKNN